MISDNISATMEIDQNIGSRASADIPERIFELVVIQGPIQARMCGFSDKDRRPIDPPPIVQLHVKDLNGNIDTRYLGYPFFVLQASLVDELSFSTNQIQINDQPTDSTYSGSPERRESDASTFAHSDDVITSPSSLEPHHPLLQTTTSTLEQLGDINSATACHSSLIGSLIVAGQTLIDINNERGTFFIFSDLSVRQEGSYRLKFTLIPVGDAIPTGELDTYPNASGVGIARIPLRNILARQRRINRVASVLTEPFQVYSPRAFPGMMESTPVSKHFADQGVKIPTRSTTRSHRRRVAPALGATDV